MAAPSLVLIGPPGAGKGTQAERLCAHYGIPHLSTGALLRRAIQEGSARGRKVAAIVAGGGLVSDALIIQMVRRRLSDDEARKGCLLDGFPRTLPQAEALTEMLHGRRLTALLLVVPDEEIVRRLSRRRTCRKCGASRTVPERSSVHGDECPLCGGRLVRREDDNPEIVRQRLATYHAVTGPLIDYYQHQRCLLPFDAVGSIDDVTRALIDGIDRNSSFGS